VFLKVLILCFSFTAMGAELTAGWRWRASSSNDDSFGTSGILHFSPVESLDFNAGARIYNTFTTVQSLHYMGEIAFRPLSFFSLRSRLHHGFRFREPTSTSHWTVSGKLAGELVLGLDAFIEVGWYERFSRIDRGLPFPTLVGSPRREHDFLVGLGLGWRLSPPWRVEARISTFDDVEVENFNNPFIEARIEHELADVGTLNAYFRYKMLLGFGRWDELMGGLSLLIPLTPPSDSGS